jgi:hypothetical protein
MRGGHGPSALQRLLPRRQCTTMRQSVWFDVLGSDIPARPRASYNFEDQPVCNLANNGWRLARKHLVHALTGLTDRY